MLNYIPNEPKEIIVSYIDPDATDSSSDEEFGRKKKAHVIHLNAPENNVNNMKKNKPKSTYYVGVRRRESGKYASYIRNPITKKLDWLGTFVTAEEASNAYHAKKSEIEENLRAKQGLGEKFMQGSPYSVLKNETSDSPNTTPQVVVEKNIKNNVMENKEGEKDKFGFINGVQVVDNNGFLMAVFVGYSTVSKAYRVFNKRTLLVEESIHVVFDEPISYIDPDVTDFSSDEEFGPKKKIHVIHLNAPENNVNNMKKNKPKSTYYVGVRRRQSGKYLNNPITKKRDWLGTFVTAEEASNAYHAKKSEIEEKLRAKQGLGEKFMQGSPSSVLKNETSDSQNTTPQVVVEKNIKNNVMKNKEGEKDKFGFINGVQVVHNNGFLMGEFGEINDLNVCIWEDGTWC
ncbi:hypothetical protein ACJIZ3_019724 [Penstemon smallii]|uniref:AP2/ERF domain-containing protein n=1 Tax=Penstemon smallii TaxID=265156 RepID=A0ABD3T248_9LAMI